MTSILTLSKQTQIFEFLDIIYSSYLILHITSPTRLTGRSHTLIDNIMSNVITEVAISEKIIHKISDYFGQFLILPYHSITSNSKQEFLQKTLRISVETIFFHTSKKEIERVYFLNISNTSTWFIKFFWIK